MNRVTSKLTLRVSRDLGYHRGMALPFLIIDGYNLMHAWGLARQRYGPGDLERLRERYLRQLANRLSEDQRRRTTVVFDAADVSTSDALAQQVHELMRIVFAADADSRIEKLIKGHSAPKQIRVVSSDKRLQKAARRRRGQFVASEQFTLELEQAEAQEKTRSVPRELEAKTSGELTTDEMAEWLEIFGESADE
jgi:uncharacterized protein